jgi:Cu(I)/Ag(I) efflux system membrane fusion protein
MNKNRYSLFTGLAYCLFFILWSLVSTPAFSQSHAGHDMQSMPEENTESVKIQDNQQTSQEETVQEVPAVEITPEQQKLIGLKTVKVSFSPLRKVIRTVGLIEVDERKMTTVNAKIEGWIEKLYVDYTGAYVKKGEPLAEIYSPELLATQLEFINALKWTRETVRAPDAAHEDYDWAVSSAEPVSGLQKMLKKDGLAVLNAARERLRLWDISEEQIKQIEETGKSFRTLTLYSPATGYITNKMAVSGIKVMPGEKIYDIADLSNLWIIADIYENELPFVQVGQEAKITLSYLPDKEFSSRIDYIYPIIDADTRTSKVRFTLSNPDGQLKPQMYTNVEININLGKRLAIPESAVIDTGMQQVAYVDLGDGNFEPREVKLGLHANGYVEVLKGLKEGEKVTSSANFLIDSEAQLKGIKPLSGQ